MVRRGSTARTRRATAGLLLAAGWRTAAFVSAFVLDARFGLDQGFERFDDELGGPGDEARWRLVVERGGADTTRSTPRPASTTTTASSTTT